MPSGGIHGCMECWRHENVRRTRPRTKTLGLCELTIVVMGIKSVYTV
jgi:hypothetical protein